jgi:hypothetical protein
MSLAVLYDPSAVISVMRLATYALAAVTIDVTLVYRLWIVWGRSWRIAAVPSLAVLFNTVGCIIIIVLSATSTDHVFSAKLKYWTSVVYSVQAATNVICSGESCCRSHEYVLRHLLFFHRSDRHSHHSQLYGIDVTHESRYPDACGMDHHRVCRALYVCDHILQRFIC